MKIDDMKLARFIVAGQAISARRCERAVWVWGGSWGMGGRGGGVGFFPEVSMTSEKEAFEDRRAPNIQKRIRSKKGRELNLV